MHNHIDTSFTSSGPLLSLRNSPVKSATALHSFVLNPRMPNRSVEPVTVRARAPEVSLQQPAAAVFRRTGSWALSFLRYSTSPSLFFAASPGLRLRLSASVSSRVG